VEPKEGGRREKKTIVGRGGNQKKKEVEEREKERRQSFAKGRESANYFSGKMNFKETTERGLEQFPSSRKRSGEVPLLPDEGELHNMRNKIPGDLA